MTDDIYNLISRDIQSKFGKEILHSKDCDQLSLLISKETNRQISSSTLKRFFGIIKTKFKPSKYTLETLSVFLGFKDWNEYLNCYDESKFSASNGNTWDILKNRVLMITEHSMESLKQKTSYSAKKMIFREFSKNDFEEFLTSSKTATMFIAPDGYGKSTLIIQLIEKYFLNKNAEFKNDIIILIDGGIFFNLYSLNPGIELLNQFLKFKISSSFSYFFQKHPEKQKGRILVMIDNIDEIFFDKDSFRQICENLVRIIMANSNNDWYKMILTCRPENLEIFTYLVNKNPLLKSCWHGVNFSEDNFFNKTNIPLFTNKEIEQFLKIIEFRHSYKYLHNNHKEVLEVIKQPYLLALFAEVFQQNKKLSEINLYQSYIERKLYSPPYMEEKLTIINDFIELCDWGKKTNTVRKDKLLSKINSTSAYYELISFGMIYEYVMPSGFIQKDTFAKFNQNVIFEYILFEKWRANQPLHSRLFFKIKDFYQNNVHLQCNILKFFVRMLIHENKIEVLKQIHAEIDNTITKNQTDFPPCILSFSSVINKALKTNTQFKKTVKPWLFRSKISMLYNTD